jgi:hypothetical protein
MKGFQPTAFNSAFQEAVPPPPVIPYLGHGLEHKTKVFLGPSLGWVEMEVRPARTITAAGSYLVLPGDSVIHVNVAGLVTVRLPDAVLWVQEPGYQPATGFERAIWVKDLGGHATAFPITITPFGSQKIDFLPSFQIVQNRQLVRLYPLNDMSGWYSG